MGSAGASIMMSPVRSVSREEIPMNEDPSTPVPEAESDPVEQGSGSIILTPGAQNYLNATGPWIRFFSILMFVGAGFMMLACVMMVLLGFVGGISTPGGPVGSWLIPGGMGIVFIGPAYFLVALLFYIVPAIFLFRCSGAINSLRANRSEMALEEAMRQQRSFWRYLGIMTIVMIILAILLFVGTVILTAFLSIQAP